MNRCCTVVLLAVACGGGAAPPRDAATTSEPTLLTVDTATLTVPFSLPAQLYVEHDAVVYARSLGVVEAIHADLGAGVRRGQLLARLEHTDQDIALAQAEEAFVAALRTVERIRELAKSRAVTAADSEAAETAHRRALLDRRQAQRDEELTRIVAPFDGVVTARWARAGRLVTDGDSLFRVSALTPLLAAVHVPETAAGTVAVGDSAAILAADGRATVARVVRASPAIDAASGTREVVVRLGDGARFRPGESVAVRLGAERRQLVAVPPDVVAEQGYVLVWEGGRPVLRAVSLGAPLPDGRLEVTGGLAPGERLVRHPGPTGR